jgi:hypothetical protein
MSCSDGIFGTNDLYGCWVVILGEVSEEHLDVFPGDM